LSQGQGDSRGRVVALTFTPRPTGDGARAFIERFAGKRDLRGLGPVLARAGALEARLAATGRDVRRAQRLPLRAPLARNHRPRLAIHPIYPRHSEQHHRPHLQGQCHLRPPHRRRRRPSQPRRHPVEPGNPHPTGTLRGDTFPSPPQLSLHWGSGSGLDASSWAGWSRTRKFRPACIRVRSRPSQDSTPSPPIAPFRSL